mgnify:CR=1 FL=1
MKYTIKKTREKAPSVYKTLYIQENLTQKIDQIARDNNTSWNNVVISMIENCISED